MSSNADRKSLSMRLAVPRNPHRTTRCSLESARDRESLLYAETRGYLNVQVNAPKQWMVGILHLAGFLCTVEQCFRCYGDYETFRAIGRGSVNFSWVGWPDDFSSSRGYTRLGRSRTPYVRCYLHLILSMPYAYTIHAGMNQPRVDLCTLVGDCCTAITDGVSI